MSSFWEQHEHIIHIVNICVGALITIVAVFGNILTLIAMLRFKHLQTKSNILIFSLSCSDVVSVLYWIILEVIHVTLKPCKTSPNLYIWLYSSFVTFFVTSVLHLIIISVERYITIIHGLYYNILLSKKRFIALVGLCWVAPLLLNLAVTPGIKNWNKENHTCFYADIWTTLCVYMATILYIICFPIILWIYYRIYRAAKSQAKQIHAFQIRGQTEGRKTDVKATKTVSLLLAAFCISWSPYCTIHVINYFSSNMNISVFVILYHITLKLGMVNSAVNFFIYAYNKKDFKDAYKQLLKIC